MIRGPAGFERRFGDVVEGVRWLRERGPVGGAVFRESDGKRITQAKGRGLSRKEED